MKVQNMTSSNGNKVANQFIVTQTQNGRKVEYFQSYDSVIAIKKHSLDGDDENIYLDRDHWDYSVTTGKYRNQFLGETKKETQAKIDSGEYILTDLN